MSVRQLSPQDVREQISDGGGQLLDVREAWEYALAHLPGACHIPLAELPSRLRELNAHAPLIVYCHHGIRSWHAACFLVQNGFEQVGNLAG
ncbi:MAG TPA: rhodanese-like domain-containing protein, partial [Gammaproteobacteria bacterium]